MTTDERYVAELKRGSHAAVERLVSEYEGPLFRYFLASHGDASLAGEQSADCLVELVRALPKLRGGHAQLRGFVYAAARNVLRRRWRARRSPDSLDSAIDVPASEPSPARTIEQRERLERTLTALGRLEAATRDVFVLAFVEELPLAEVSEVLGMPLGTVKSRIHRGRKELKRMLETDEASP